MSISTSRRRFMQQVAGTAFGASLLNTYAAGEESVAGVPQDKWRTLMPERGMISERPATRWQDALVSGNGRMGAMVYGKPDDRIILNHHKFNQPQAHEPVPPPDMVKYVPEVRRRILAGEYEGVMRFWAESMRAEGHPIAIDREDQKELPGILWTDAVHPGYALDVTTSPKGDIHEYLRSTDFRTGEITVQWSDDRGKWKSRLFVSRADDVIVHEIVPPEGAAVIYSIEDQLEGINTVDRDAWPRLQNDFRARFETAATDDGWLVLRAHYNPERSNRGFEGVTHIINNGGDLRIRNNRIHVRGAASILTCTRLSRLEDYNDSQIAANQKAIAGLPGEYATLMAAHAAIHTPIYDRVKVDFNVGSDRLLSAEALLEKQKRQGSNEPLNRALLEKMFDMGRYVFLCSSGDWPPRLQGIWVGSWDSPWRGDFTTDANVNLAVSGGNIGAMPEPMGGYLNLIEGIADDWRTNAKRLYGCRGMLSGPRTDGEHNLHTHHSTGFPGHFWIAGAQWLVQPLYETWQVTGDDDYLRKHVLPLLKEIALFYEDFLTEHDANGDYIFVPSYSPEQKPANVKSPAVMNATMDIAAAKENLSFLIHACRVLEVEEDSIPRWQAMMDKLPPYLVNDDGALKEWAHPDLQDHYNHRHLSHLYPLWPGHEINPEDTPELYNAAGRAATLREMGNESAHGLMHMGLVAARLKDEMIVERNLGYLLSHDYVYTSLVTSHNPNHKIYNVDASCSLPAIVMEMLVYSRPGIVELLPALPKTLQKGQVDGIRCRGQVAVEKLAWDLDSGTIECTLMSLTDQAVTLIYRKGMGEILINGSTAGINDMKRLDLSLKKNASTRIKITIQ